MEQHYLLVVEDESGKKIYSLDASAYSLGRDPTNAIVLQCNKISRQHALLLRMPVPGSKDYKYRIIDGNSLGNRSANGITVNGCAQTSWDLGDGDEIYFGSKVKARYLLRQVSDPNLKKYINSPAYRSIKAETIDPNGTLVAGLPKNENPFIISEVPETFLYETIIGTVVNIDAAMLKSLVTLKSGRQLEASVKSPALAIALQPGDLVKLQMQPNNTYLLLEKYEVEKREIEKDEAEVPELDGIKLAIAKDAQLYRYCFDVMSQAMAGLNLSEESLSKATNLIFRQNISQNNAKK
jgi:pSer/pThr/pTyr-binding forkhead associated (FHA) protein